MYQWLKVLGLLHEGCDTLREVAATQTCAGVLKAGQMLQVDWHVQCYAHAPAALLPLHKGRQCQPSILWGLSAQAFWKSTADSCGKCQPRLTCMRAVFTMPGEIQLTLSPLSAHSVPRVWVILTTAALEAL